MSDPTLGFSVDTSGLDKGNQALDQTLDKSKKVEDQANKTSDALGKMGSKSGDGLSKTAQSAEQLAASLIKATDASGKALGVTQQLDQIVSKTGVSYAQANQALRDAFTAHKSVAESVNSHSRSLESLTSSTSGAIASIGGIARAAGPVAIGIAAIGAAAGPTLIAMQKLNDESLILKTRLEGLAGVRLGDMLAGALEKAGDSASHLPKSLEPAIESLVRFQQVNDTMGVSVKATLDLVQTMYEKLRLGGASTEEATKATNKFFEDLAKNGAVTKDMIESVAHASPAAAQSIVDLFTGGGVSVAAFNQALGKTPLSFQAIQDELRRTKASTDTAFQAMINNPQSFDAALEKLKNKLADVGVTMKTALKLDGATSAGPVVQAISFIADKIAALDGALKNMEGSARLQALIQVFKDLGSIASFALAPVISALTTLGDAMLSAAGMVLDGYSKIREAVVGVGTTIAEFVLAAIKAGSDFASSFVQLITDGFNSVVKAITDGVNAGIESVSRFVTDTINLLTGWASSAIGYVDQVKQALSGVGSNIAEVASGKGQGGSDNAQYDAMGNVVGFATGGQFTVSGSGGTDSQLVQFWATPGEQVTVKTPSQAASGNSPSSKGGLPAFAEGGSFTVGGKTLGDMLPSDSGSLKAISDIASAHIAADLKEQTATLGDRLNAASTTIAAAITKADSDIVAAVKAIPSAGSVASSGAASTSAGGSSSPSIGSSASGGGGGGGTVDPWKDINAENARNAQQQAAQDQQANAANMQAAQIAAQMTAQQAQMANQRSMQKATLDQQGKQLDEQARQFDEKMEFEREKQAASGRGVSGPPASSGSDSGLLGGAKNSLGDFYRLNRNGAGDATSPDYTSSPAYTSSRGYTSQPKPGPLPATDPFAPSSYGGHVPGMSGSVKDAANLANGVAPPPISGGNDLQQQTNTLKQAQDTGSKTIADQVKTNADTTKTVGEKTNSSLNDLSKVSADQLKSLDTVQQSTDDGTEATKADTEATTSGFDDTKSGLGDIQTAATQTTEGVGQTTNAVGQTTDAVGQTTDAVSTGSSSIVDAISSLASSFSNAISNAASSASSSGASGFGSDISSGSDSFDSGSASGFDFAGAVADGTLPAFASGGQFTVSGSGGTDTEHVEFMATPGEVVTITPPGGQAPHNPAMGAAPSTKGSIAAYATGGQFTVGLASEGDGFKTLGSTLGAPGNPGATADLISAHFAATAKDQTASLKDAIGKSTSLIVAAVNAGTAGISTAVNALRDSLNSTISAAARSSSTGAPSTSTPRAPSATGWGQPYLGTPWPNGMDPGKNYFDNQNPYINTPGTSYQNNTRAPSTGSQVHPQPSLQGFATGGSFTVGGSGGTDTQVVKFKATPGEIVSITPPGKANNDSSIAPLIPLHNDNIPGASFAPTLSMTPQTSSAVVGRVVPHGDPSANPSQGARNVNIYVQQGVQADQFIRSRAEMQRAMR